MYIDPEYRETSKRFWGPNRRIYMADECEHGRVINPSREPIMHGSVDRVMNCQDECCQCAVYCRICLQWRK